MDIEIDPVERTDTGESLRDAAQGEQGFSRLRVGVGVQLGSAGVG
jgi:hypothetical protein